MMWREAPSDAFDPRILDFGAAVPVYLNRECTGITAWVSPEDAPIVALLRWRLHVPGAGSMGNGHGSAGFKEYARTTVKLDGRRADIYLHRFLLCVSDGHFVDHIDGDGLNCRRENLREATPSENALNRRNSTP